MVYYSSIGKPRSMRVQGILRFYGVATVPEFAFDIPDLVPLWLSTTFPLACILKAEGDTLQRRLQQRLVRQYALLSGPLPKVIDEKPVVIFKLEYFSLDAPDERNTIDVEVVIERQKTHAKDPSVPARQDGPGEDSQSSRLPRAPEQRQIGGGDGEQQGLIR